MCCSKKLTLESIFLLNVRIKKVSTRLNNLEATGLRLCCDSSAVNRCKALQSMTMFTMSLHLLSYKRGGQYLSVEDSSVTLYIHRLVTVDSASA